jgi:hypothetical protein
MSCCAFNASYIKNIFNLKFYRLLIAETFVKLRGFVFNVTKHGARDPALIINLFDNLALTLHIK